MSTSSTNNNNKKTLYVGGLEDNVTLDTLRGAFIPFGDIVDISLPMDHKTHKHKGFCFIEFESREDALDAMDNMNDSEIFGRTINCTIAKPTTVNKNRAVWSSENYKDETGGSEETGDGRDQQKEFIEEKMKEALAANSK
ncbi:hypothetical protein SAMD00019534_005100 [Acytostelium subglobosum LB1]|uniref:hypothetical protein n=1 Tax=Acytostelium subglobosum LB1 TaxID=1410327 RepID=UPI00064494C3|nr:hypothetical protein SAMD00019534_005100 [Acytostelium subglobosum LB1]GAM17335.1 hypothetical protein SAMD00019534_005100 [Acytostelium subglobosum LB1]|eukprot:XP_012759397.1 hypothetical protein SAMD00019534_005100 [Acytostelium subglobosum LB1]